MCIKTCALAAQPGDGDRRPDPKKKKPYDCCAADGLRDTLAKFWQPKHVRKGTIRNRRFKRASELPRDVMSLVLPHLAVEGVVSACAVNRSMRLDASRCIRLARRTGENGHLAFWIGDRVIAKIDKLSDAEEYDVKMNLRGELIVQQGKYNKPTVAGLLHGADTSIVRVWDVVLAP